MIRTKERVILVFLLLEESGNSRSPEWLSLRTTIESSSCLLTPRHCPIERKRYSPEM